MTPRSVETQRAAAIEAWAAAKKLAHDRGNPNAIQHVIIRFRMNNFNPTSVKTLLAAAAALRAAVGGER